MVRRRDCMAKMLLGQHFLVGVREMPLVAI